MSGPLNSKPVLSSAPRILDSACCPIPAADWRSSSQPGSSAGSSPDNNNLSGKVASDPRVAAAIMATSSASSRSLPVSLGGSTDWNSINVPVGSPAWRQSLDSTPAGSPPSSVHNQRRSMSSLCPSAAEARLEVQNSQQLQHTLAAAGGSGVLAPSGGSGVLGGGGRGGSVRGHRTSGTLPVYHEALSGPMAQQVRKSSDALPRTASAPPQDQEEQQCVNWEEVEQLCANMDKAGVRLEDIDIMCLPDLPESSGRGVPQPMATKKPSDGNPTLLSLKFSSMTSRHYPGDQNAKQMFQDVLSR